MIQETVQNGKYIAVDTDTNSILCTIESLGNNVYKASNKETQITAEIIPLDKYKTSTKCIENKRIGKDGKFRKTSKLAEHNVSWLLYMLEEKGLI